MKPTIAIVLLLCLLPNGSAQGPVNFAKRAAFQTDADRRVLDIDENPLFGTNWFAQLYYGADANSLIPVTASPARFMPLTVDWLPGTWFGGTRVLDRFNPGDPVTLQVKVWDRALFGTFEQAVAGGGIYGQSEPVRVESRFNRQSGSNSDHRGAGEPSPQRGIGFNRRGSTSAARVDGSPSLSSLSLGG